MIAKALFFILFICLNLSANNRDMITKNLEIILTQSVNEMDLAQVKNILSTYAKSNDINCIEFYNQFDPPNKPTFRLKELEKCNVNDSNKKIAFIRYNGLLEARVFLYFKKKRDNLLTSKDKKYIKNHTIKVNITANWPPFYFIDHGKLTGIAIDYFKLIAKKLDLKYEIAISKPYTKVLEHIKQKKSDITIATTKTSENLKFGYTTDRYERYKIAVATRKDIYYIRDLSVLNGKKVAVGKNFSSYFLVKDKYPKINFIFTKNTVQALKLLEKKRVYAAIDIEPVLYFLKSRENFKDLSIHRSRINFDLMILTKKDDGTLKNILNKGINSISADEKSTIYKKWATKFFESKTDYTLLINTVIVFLLILLAMVVVYARENRLKNRIKIINQTLEEKIKEAVLKNQRQQAILVHQTRLAQIGEMISMIAHQWRQPLNNISLINNKISLRAYKKQLDSKEIIELTQKTMKIIKYMSETIDDFRDFFKPNKEKTKVRLVDIIQNSIELIKPTLVKYHIKIDLKESAKEIEVVCFKNDLQQVFLNIISNAKDALLNKNTKDSKIIITIAKEDEAAIIRIEDNAGGIPEDIIEKIFDPYFSTKREKEGTGIGLYMLKMIVEKYSNGEITVKNGKNGALFEIRLKVTDD